MQAILAAMLVFCWSPDTVLARDRIALPYSCTLESGRLRVERTAEQSYPIVGQHEQQPYTYCPTEDGGACKTWTVHRFSVQCSGGRVAWPEIVAAAAGRDQRRVTVENGQLLFRVGQQRGTLRDRLCADADRAPGKAPLTWGQCQLQGFNGQRAAFRTHVVALPRGFAPLAMIGARIVIEPEPAARQSPLEVIKQPSGDKPPMAERVPTVQPVAAPLPPVAPAVLPKLMARALANDSVDVVELSAVVEESQAPALSPLATILPDHTAQPAKPVSIAWTAKVEPSQSVSPMREDGSAGGPSQSLMQLIGLMLLATVLFGTTSVALRRRSGRANLRRIDPGFSSRPLGGDGDGPRAIALRTKSEGHIALIGHALDRLATVAPLRNALARELQSSERRLAVVIAAISSTGNVQPDDWARARRRLERIAQDLDRLQHISDGAVMSLSGLTVQRSLPRDKSEAYATLGVTEGVSESILKKLVDALRVSWHPDLARGEADREMRDARIKEINVAWDLITGKRAGD